MCLLGNILIIPIETLPTMFFGCFPGAKDGLICFHVKHKMFPDSTVAGSVAGMVGRGNGPRKWRDAFPNGSLRDNMRL